MQAKWGIAWLAAALLLLSLLCAPALAAGDSTFRPFNLLPVSGHTSLETQMLGEKPPSPGSTVHPGLQGPSLKLHNEGGDASIKMPFGTELNISIRYNRDPSPADPQALSKSPLFMKYAVDYRLLSNLRVGLNSYLYRPAEEGFAFQRSMGSPLMGVGPELKYDLGRWSFLLKSQLETGNRDQGKDLQNWFRVWYAF